MIAAMTARRSVALELGVIALLTLTFLATFRERPSYVDFALAGLAVALIAASAARSRRLWQSVPPPAADGRGLRGAAVQTAIFTLAALAALAAVTLWMTSGELVTGAQVVARFASSHFFLAILVYFPWALLQQYIFQTYLLGRLLQLAPTAVAVVSTAVVFSSVHFPRWPVMALTAIAGVFWTFTYYRHRVLLPLALSHAILGAALHYWVFGRDLFALWSSLSAH
jgi:membrane protease YdiL (CAAX protease family)